LKGKLTIFIIILFKYTQLQVTAVSNLHTHCQAYACSLEHSFMKTKENILKYYYGDLIMSHSTTQIHIDL